MRDPISEFIHFHGAGEMPKASEWNSLVSIAKRDRFEPNLLQVGPFQGIAQRNRTGYNMRVRITETAEDYLAYQLVSLAGYVSTGAVSSNVVVEGRAWEPDGSVGSGVEDCVIIGRNDLGTDTLTQNLGWCEYGDRPCLADTGTGGAIGACVGPKWGEKTLMPGYSGFRVLGNYTTGARTIQWVIRDGGVPYGKALMKSGDVLCDTAQWYQGFNTSDTNGEITVVNLFSDAFEASKQITFVWNASAGQYEIANSNC